VTLSYIRFEGLSSPRGGQISGIYTAFSRGTDEARNVQTYFEWSQNVNRFKVKR
jgi:hypothetical protein